MAYNIKWFSEFDDESGENIYRVDILDRDFVGSSVEVTSGGDPVRVQMMDVSDPFQVMRSLKFTFQWISDDVSGFDISDLFITDDRKYKFQFSKYEGESRKLLYTGYLVFVDCQEPFNSKPYPVTLSGTCSLPFIRDDYFLDGFGSFVEGKISLIKVIANCLSSTGLELPIHTFVNLYESGMSYGVRSSLDWAEIDSDGLRGKKGGEVLEGILGALNAFIVQSDGAWIIKGVREQESYLGQERRFDHNGNFTGYSLVGQSASFGRTAYSFDTPNVRPINGVEESFSEPNSIARVTVSPGIPVNRLPNGTFSGPIFGGNVPGWSHNFNALQHPSGAGWTRSGTGRPDDPYKIDITGADTYGSRGVPSNMHIPNPIVINTGAWDTIRNRDSKVRLVISGAYRAADISWFKLYVRLNDGDKDWGQFMDENGKWNPSKKKQQTFAQINVDVPANPPVSSNFEDANLQTFEITTDRITDFLQRSGNSVAHFYFEVRAGYVTTDKSKFHTLNPRLTWEDFSVCVTTETMFETEHRYEVDAKFPIRNPNDVEHSIIIADKIGIDTPEQRRAENRVMTGYMTLQGGNSLTSGWKRFPGGSPDSRDPDFEPIQKKCLRERIRLYCGKRSVIEGSFKGVGLLPHHSVFNRFENSSSPNKFYSVQSWEWSPKTMEYDASFFELNFDPLPDEVIGIPSEGGGGRGNRLYSGGGGSTQYSGNGSVALIEQITLDDPEPYEYEVLVEDEEDRICDIKELVQSDHAVDLLESKLLYAPDWISEISIYRGEDLEEEDLPDGGILQVLWKGKPTKSGNYQILVELVASTGADYTLSIPIVVEPSEDFIESWPPKFIEVPPLYFEKGKESIESLNIFDYLDPDGDHDGTGLGVKLLSKPIWVSSSTVVFGTLAATGKPTQLGDDVITYEISDAIGRVTFIPFPVKVVEPLEFTHELPGIGEIPGTYELPANFTVKTTVEGEFDRFVVSLKGGGDTGTDVDFTSDAETISDVYETEPFTSDAGQFVYEFSAYRGEKLIKKDTVNFVLGDEEYLSKVKAYLTKEDAVVGEISPDGTTVFVNPETANIKAVIDDIEHDKVVLTMGDVVKTYTVVDTEYLLFDEDVIIEEGEHTFEVELFLEDVLIQKRSYSFEIGKPDTTKPTGGLKMVTFKPGTTNYTVVKELPLKAGIMEIPDNYSILFDGEGEGSGTWQFYKLVDNAYEEITVENPLRILHTVNEILIFGKKNSTQIADAHDVAGSYRVVFTIRDKEEQLAGVLQSDFSFREQLAPEDYSGLQFYTEKDNGTASTGVTTLIDANVPKLGASYQLPALGNWWLISFTGFADGRIYDRGRVEMWKDGVPLEIEDGYVKDITFTEEVSASDPTRICSMGWPDNSNERKRFLFRISDHVTAVIDEPGLYRVAIKVYHESVLLEILETTITLTEPLPEPPIKDCCDGGGELIYLWNDGAETLPW